MQGVLEFYKQMEIGPDDDLGIWPEGRLGNLVCEDVAIAVLIGY